jgi:hypothetical protein
MSSASPSEVKDLIRSSFPSPEKSLSHAECVYMRSRLALLDAKDLPRCLAQILIDLIDTHTGIAGESEDAEAVVQSLDVFVSGTDLEFIRKEYGEEALRKTIEDENYLRQAAKKDFINFNPRMANAIYEWLKLAHTWQDLKWYSKDILNAMEYWSKRASGE